MHLPAHPLLLKLARIIGLLILGSLILSVVDSYRKQGITAEYQEAYAKAKSENEDLKRRLAEVQTPEFIEQAARDKLGLVKEGETLILMETPAVKGTAQADTPGDAGKLTDSAAPNWKKWWKLLF